MASESSSVAVATVGSREVTVEITPNISIVTPRSGDVEMVSRRSLSERMSDLTDLINNAATGLVASIDSLPAAARPKTIEAEFSIAFSAESGFWYIAKGTASGTFKVKLQWQLQERSTHDS